MIDAAIDMPTTTEPKIEERQVIRLQLRTKFDWKLLGGHHGGSTISPPDFRRETSKSKQIDWREATSLIGEGRAALVPLLRPNLTKEGCILFPTIAAVCQILFLRHHVGVTRSTGGPHPPDIRVRVFFVRAREKPGQSWPTEGGLRGLHPKDLMLPTFLRV